MNQDQLINTKANAQSKRLSQQLEHDMESQATAYHPVKAVQTLRVRARVRSILVGKPLRYDLPNEE